MDPQSHDLSQLVIDFIDSMPATIRTDILFFVIPYALNEGVPDEIEKFSAVVTDSIRTVGGMRKMSALIRVIAALDHILFRAATNLRSAKATMESAPGISQEIFDRFQARYPLERRHIDKALADWRKLRDVRLTPQNLVDYENNLLRPRFREQ